MLPGNIFKGLIFQGAHFHILQTIDLLDLLQKVLSKMVLCVDYYVCFVL